MPHGIPYDELPTFQKEAREQELSDAKAAVIEAAKKYKHATASVYRSELVVLVEAVERLEQLEAEE